MLPSPPLSFLDLQRYAARIVAAQLADMGEGEIVQTLETSTLVGELERRGYTVRGDRVPPPMGDADG